MQKLLFVLVVVLALQVAAQEELTWYNDIAAAFQKATQENKIVFVDCYTDWCSWCKKLDKETFSAPSFQQIAQNFVLLKVNGDKEYEFCTKYQVRAYPTMLFLKADGKEIQRIKGFVTAEVLVPQMQKILEGNRSAVTWFTNIDEAFNAAQAQNRVVFVDMYTDWCSWCKKLDKETFSDASFQQAAASFILLKVNGDNSPEFKQKYAIKYYPTLLFLKADGVEVKRIVGFVTAAQLVPVMKEISGN